MDTFLKIWYTMRHETLWKTKAVGKAETSSDKTAKGWEYLSSSCQRDMGFFKLCSSLGASLSEGRSERAAIQTNAWPSLSFDRFAEKEVTELSFKRSSGCWLYNRPVDIRADCQINRGSFWLSLSSWSCLAFNESPSWLELPEAGTESPSKERISNPEVETLQVAPYKKTPNGLELTWYSLTKVASSLFLTLKGHGLPVARRQYSIIFTSRTGFLPLVQSQFPLKGNGWGCISDFGKEISLVIWWQFSSVRFSSIYTGISSSFGIMDPSIGISRLRIYFIVILGYIKCFFHLMLQNLTQLSMSGINPIRHWLMAFQETFITFARNYIKALIEFVILKRFSGRVYMPANFLGNVKYSIHYLCETQ